MKKSHATKVIIPAIVIIFTAIAALSYSIFAKVEESLTDVATHKIANILDETAFNIGGILDQLENLQKTIITEKQIENLLQEPKNADQKKQAIQIIKDLVKESTNDTWRSISVFSKQNNVILSLDANANTVDKQQKPLYDYLDAKNQANIKPSIHLSADTKIVYLSTPIYINKEFMGSIELHINSQSIMQLLDKYAKKISPHAILVIANHQGTIFNISGYTHDSSSLPSNLGAFEKLLRTTLPDDVKIITSTYMHNLGIYIGLYQSISVLSNVSNYLQNEVAALIGITLLLACIGTYIFLSLTIRKQNDEGQRLSQAVELMQMPMWEYISPGILHLNAYAFNLLGKKDQSLAFDMESMQKIIHPNDIKDGLFTNVNMQGMQSQIKFETTLRFKHEDGHWHWLQLKGHINQHNDNTVQQAAGIFIDIHEWRLKMEQDEVYKRSLEKVVQEQYEKVQKQDNQILYEKSLLYNVINCIPDYIYFKDTDGRCLGGNQAFLDLIGHELADIRGKIADNIPLPFTLNKEDAAFLVNDKYVIESDCVIRNKITLHYDENRILPLEMFKVSIKDHLDNAVGVVSIARDISEHIAIEDALRHAKEAATAANTAKSDFLANMSHEIRTPLNGIIGLNHLAQQQDASIEVRGYLEKIDISAKTLLKIVNDILDFSKIEAGRIDLEYIPFRIARSIQFAIDMLQVQANERKIYINLVTEGEIPEYILGDPLRFRQTMLNLLNNAVKFTSEGGVTLTIIVDQKIAHQADITIKIQDTGIGMSKSQIARIFQPFMQADSSTTRRYGGTGLGLPITRSLIEAMGSKLIVESEENVGSTFSFTLHAQIPTNINTDKSPEDESKENLERMKGKKILLVEDNEINQLIATEVLENFGLIVSVACDGQQGVDMAMHGDFDLILMDIQMPVMDGLTAAKTLRYNQYTKPIIAMTANALPEDKIKAREAGMQEHIGKPFDIQVLQNCLAMWLDANNKI